MNITYRKSIRVSELSNFLETIKTLFVVSDKIISLTQANDILKAKQLQLESLTNEQSVIIQPQTTASEYIITPSDNYIGISNCHLTLLPLENLVITEPITPISADSKIVLTKSSTDFSGLNSVCLKDIAISSNISYTMLVRDLDGSQEPDKSPNKKTFCFHNKNTSFGTKLFSLDIPTIPMAVLTATPQTVAAKFMPAAKAAGITGKGGSTAPICIQTVKLDAARTSFTETEFNQLAVAIEKTTLQKADDKSDALGRSCICFDKVTINPADKSVVFSPNKQSFWEGGYLQKLPKKGHSCIHKVTIANLPVYKQITANIEPALQQLLHHNVALTKYETLKALSVPTPLLLNVAFKPDLGAIDVENPNISSNTGSIYISDLQNTTYDYINQVTVGLPKQKSNITSIDYINNYQSQDNKFVFDNNLWSNTVDLPAMHQATYEIDLVGLSNFCEDHSTNISLKLIPSQETDIGVDIEPISNINFNGLSPIDANLLKADPALTTIFADKQLPALESVEITFSPSSGPYPSEPATWICFDTISTESAAEVGSFICQYSDYMSNGTAGIALTYPEVYDCKGSMGITITSTNNGDNFDLVKTSDNLWFGNLYFITQSTVLFCKSSSDSNDYHSWYTPTWRDSSQHNPIEIPIAYYDTLTDLYDNNSSNTTIEFDLSGYNPQDMYAASYSGTAEAVASNIISSFNGWELDINVRNGNSGSTSTNIWVDTSNLASIAAALTNCSDDKFNLVTSNHDSSVCIDSNVITLDLHVTYANSVRSSVENYNSDNKIVKLTLLNSQI